MHSLGGNERPAVCHRLLVILLLGWMGANLCSQLTGKSITADEIIHIPAGYYHLLAGNYTLNNEHPPLVKMWAALPMLFVQPNEPPVQPDAFDPQTRTADAFVTFWVANGPLFETISFWARVPMILLTLGLGWAIFRAGCEFGNPRAGVLAVALFAFEPTMLAHGRIVHTDVPAALAYLLFALAFARYFRVASTRTALVLGVTTSLALATKFSLVLVGPLFVAAMLVLLFQTTSRGLRRGQIVRHAFIAALAGLLVINLVYRFDHGPLRESDMAWINLKLPEHARLITGSIHVLSTILPTYFLYGISNVAMHNQFGHAGSLLGQQSDFGWWYYFPVAFALKTSLAFLIVTLLALGWALWRLAAKRDYAFLFLLLPLGAYTALSLTSGINIGVRHFLPAFPFFFVFGGLMLDAFLRGRGSRFFKIGLVAAALGAMALEAMRAYPDYIPYMNQLRGSRPRWELLSDSNVEWGDDVKALAAYLRAKGETQISATLAAGWLTTRFYGVEYLDLFALPEGEEPKTNYVAIGASFFNGSTVPGTDKRTGPIRENFFAAYRTQKPEAIFGQSIYLFRVR